MGLLIDGVKYIILCNDNAFKQKSFEDNIYFTLRDIFLNADSCETALRVNSIISPLTQDVYFEDRTESCEYKTCF